MLKPHHHRRGAFCLELALLMCISALATAGPDARSFNCSNAFDLIATAVNIRCAYSSATVVDELTAATASLVDAGFITPHEAATIAVSWCSLEHVLGFTPDAAHIFVNEDLEAGGTALLAEVIAHEMIHTRQYALRGGNRFKCDYVAAFIACGACQGRGHRLEREAYEYQDQVRAYFLENWQPKIENGSKD